MILPAVIPTSFAPDDPLLVKLIASGVLGGPPDPLAPIMSDIVLRLQAHRGDNVPYRLWTDLAKTDPAEIDDTIAVWDWPGLPTVEQSNAMDRPALKEEFGVPVIDHAGAKYLEGPTDILDGSGLCISALVWNDPDEENNQGIAGAASYQASGFGIARSGGGIFRTICNRVGAEAGAQIAGPVTAEWVVVTGAINASGVTQVWLNGVEGTPDNLGGAYVASASPFHIGKIEQSGWGDFTKKSESFIVYRTPANRALVESYLQTLKPPTP